MDVLSTAHQLFGYLVAILILAIATAALALARDPRPFAPGPFVLTAVVIDVQVLGGLAVYVLGGFWDHPSPLVSYVHPLLALSALAVSHAGLALARRRDTSADSYRTSAAALLATLVLVAGAIAAIGSGLAGEGA